MPAPYCGPPLQSQANSTATAIAMAITTTFQGQDMVASLLKPRFVARPDRDGIIQINGLMVPVCSIGAG